jgi:hypothetical protein
VQNEDSKSLIEADKRIRNIFKDNDFVQNENSKFIKLIGKFYHFITTISSSLYTLR